MTKYRSRLLEGILIFITALTKPPSWVLLGVFFISISAFKEVSKIPWFYIENWKTILLGMANPQIPIYEKFFIVGVFFLFAATAAWFLSIAVHMVIQRYVRFGKKPDL